MFGMYKDMCVWMIMDVSARILQEQEELTRFYGHWITSVNLPTFNSLNRNDS